jgi:hypothetical protein
MALPSEFRGGEGCWAVGSAAGGEADFLDSPHPPREKMQEKTMKTLK